MMFTAYFDESGTHKNSAIVVAGYIATDEQWTEFRRNWSDLLQGEGVSHLHRTDLESFQKEFKCWDKSRQIRVIKQAQGIIKLRVNTGFASGLIKVHYDEIIKKELRDEYGKDYYTFCVRDCLRHIVNWAIKYSQNKPIRYVFESGAEGQSEVEAIFQAIDKNEKDKALLRLSDWSFKDKLKVLPLQAADFCAYEMWKQMQNQIVNGKQRDLRKSFANLLKVKHISNYFDRENLIELVEIRKSGKFR